MKIRTQMIIILVTGVGLTVLVQALASPGDTIVVGRLLVFEGVIALPFALWFLRVMPHDPQQ